MNMEKLHNRKFKIFGSTWTIKIVETIKEEEEEDGTHYCSGMTYNVTKIIEVARNVYGTKITEEEMFKTFCHELIHAILNTGSYFRSSSDEPMVEFLGRGIAELIKQNVLCK